MKRLLALGILVAGLLLHAPTAQAHDLAAPGREAGALASQAFGPCSIGRLSALRGTYAFTGTAWQDLSELNPELPSGYVPVSIIGAFRLNSNGDLTGWALINAGGLQMTAEFVNSQFGALNADCGFPISLSMKIKEYGGVITGPYSYVGVVAGDMPALEILFMMLGTGPGSHVELNHAKRISMDFR